MAFLNFLGGDQNPLLSLANIGGDSGFNMPLGNPSGPRRDALDAMVPAPVQQRHGNGLGFKDILGILGDSILQAHGRQPIYGPLHEKRQLQGALQNFLTDPDSAIQALMKVDAPTAINLYKMVHPTKAEPDIVVEMRAAGIDPTSEEGKALIKEHLGRSGASSSFIQDLGAAGIDPKSPEGQRLLYAHMSPAGYLIDPPRSTGPQVGQMINGYRFKGGNPNDRNSWEPIGGASPSTGSATFP